MSDRKDIFKHYPGGKNVNGTYHKIINLIPPHYTYIEGCLGGGAILRHKRPSAVTVGNDLSPRVYQAWKDYVMDNFSMFNIDVLKLITSIKAGKYLDPFLYLDLPYIKEIRRSQKDIYDFESTTELHEGMLSSIANVDFNCMISTYPSELYAEKLKDWVCYQYESMTRGGVATELLYMNYPAPTELHDYQYLGADCWKRQAIKRKIERRVKTLSKLPILEQRAIMASLNERLALGQHN